MNSDNIIMGDKMPCPICKAEAVRIHDAPIKFGCTKCKRVWVYLGGGQWESEPTLVAVDPEIKPGDNYTDKVKTAADIQSEIVIPLNVINRLKGMNIPEDEYFEKVKERYQGKEFNQGILASLQYDRAVFALLYNKELTVDLTGESITILPAS